MNYPLLNVFWTILEVFLWVIWFWVLIMVFIDIFRSPDLSSWGKTLWFLFVLLIPLVGVLVYLIARGAPHDRSVRRRSGRMRARRYVQEARRSPRPARPTSWRSWLTSRSSSSRLRNSTTRRRSSSPDPAAGITDRRPGTESVAGPGAGLVLVTPGSGQFLMTLDSSVMNVAIATVAKDVGTTVTGIQTAITLYTLVMAMLMIPGGKVGSLSSSWAGRFLRELARR